MDQYNIFASLNHVHTQYFGCAVVYLIRPHNPVSDLSHLKRFPYLFIFTSLGARGRFDMWRRECDALQGSIAKCERHI